MGESPIMHSSNEENTVKLKTWISFDLGIGGDYDGMYSWLDNHEARECGINFAYLQYDFIREGPEGFEELKEDLKVEVNLTKKDRIYIVVREQSGQLRARFLFGKRKRPPWTA